MTSFNETIKFHITGIPNCISGGEKCCTSDHSNKNSNGAASNPEIHSLEVSSNPEGAI